VLGLGERAPGGSVLELQDDRLGLPEGGARGLELDVGGGARGLGCLIRVERGAQRGLACRGAVGREQLQLVAAPLRVRPDRVALDDDPIALAGEGVDLLAEAPDARLGRPLEVRGPGGQLAVARRQLGFEARDGAAEAGAARLGRGERLDRVRQGALEAGALGRRRLGHRLEALRALRGPCEARLERHGRGACLRQLGARGRRVRRGGGTQLLGALAQVVGAAERLLAVDRAALREALEPLVDLLADAALARAGVPRPRRLGLVETGGPARDLGGVRLLRRRALAEQAVALVGERVDGRGQLRPGLRVLVRVPRVVARGRAQGRRVVEEAGGRVEGRGDGLERVVRESRQRGGRGGRRRRPDAAQDVVRGPREHTEGRAERLEALARERRGDARDEDDGAERQLVAEQRQAGDGRRHAARVDEGGDRARRRRRDHARQARPEALQRRGPSLAAGAAERAQAAAALVGEAHLGGEPQVAYPGIEQAEGPGGGAALGHELPQRGFELVLRHRAPARPGVGRGRSGHRESSARRPRNLTAGRACAGAISSARVPASRGRAASACRACRWGRAASRR
jgi:hypothetical protein